MAEAADREASHARGLASGRAIMRWSMAALYLTAGIAHVAVPDKFLLITPHWVPYAAQVILLTGLCEIAGSVALVSNTRLRWWAGAALALYALCVWPANFKHALDGIALPYIGSSWWYHGPRLAFQPVLIWWALYCSGVTDWPWHRQIRPWQRLQ